MDTKATVVCKSFCSHHDMIGVKQEDNERAVVTLQQIHRVEDNVSLVVQAVLFLQSVGVKWVGMEFYGSFKTIKNADILKQVYQPGVKPRLIYCEIDRFVDFYKKNLSQVTTERKMYVEKQQPDPEGWVKVINPKTFRRQQIKKLWTDIDLISSNWGGF